jgi:hypothetical protein
LIFDSLRGVAIHILLVGNVHQNQDIVGNAHPTILRYCMATPRKLSEIILDSYINKCKSAFYGNAEDKKPLKTFDVFYQAALRYPQAAMIWIEHLEGISKTDTLSILNRIPQKWISHIAVEFAQKILELNQNKLLNLKELLQ